jgi:NAD(P)-dependent dehydrogenase (short-subunit alcohol dehydrogenase family)
MRGYRGNRQARLQEGMVMTKTWLITGSSRGFGRELVKAVLASGDQAVATARRPEQLDDLVRQYGNLVRTAPLDVTDPVAAAAAVQLAINEFGGLDVVVNNAGYAVSAPIEAMTLEDFRAQIEANLFGVVNVTKAALPVLHKQRSGHFIQFSSIGGRVGGTPGMGAYQTAKFGVEGFSEVLRNEVKPLGIKVTIIEPGAFRTDWGGSSMTAVPVSADYDQTVGEMNRYRESTVNTWPGDPARAAKIITDLVGLDEPPARLLLGAGAVESAREASEARAAEAEMWADVSRSADFPARNPLELRLPC